MKKIILGVLIGITLISPFSVKADEVIVHRCEATGYSLAGQCADGSFVDEYTTNVVAAKKEWIGGTMIVFLDEGDGVIKAKNYIGTYEIRDTGSEPIKNGSCIDIHMKYEDAVQFGRKNVIIQVVKGKG